ncbi:MAG: hypothetical protein FWG81_04130 [Betaproteobacteria bacterium]|nr:hypothetical protein [Betaproteobacteria bacterium]
MRLSILLGGLSALLFLGACGVDVAVTAGNVAELEAKAAEEALKQKEQAVERINEATRLIEQQRQGMADAAGDPHN